MSIADKLKQIAENERKVYEAGYNKGKSEGGGDSYYDEFWDEYQDNGNRTNCIGMFMGAGWNENTMKPKYNVVVKSTYMMFAYCGYKGDLADVFENRGVSLTFEILEGAGNNQGYMFYNSQVKAVGTIDISGINSASGVSSMFNSTYLETIRNLIPPQCAMGASCWNTGLINLGIGGAITKDFNLSRCSKLTAESVQSVIDHLADLTGGTKQTLTLHSTVSAKLTNEQKDTIANKNWQVA
jgi:hypothetical protein